MVEDKLIWSITKMYNNVEFNPNESSLGYKIDVYQESINKYFVDIRYLNKELICYIKTNHSFRRSFHQFLFNLSFYFILPYL